MEKAGAGWVISSEIQPLETRCLGQGVTVFMSMINSAIIGQCFLTMLCTMEYGVYILFSVCQLGGAVFCIFFLPETKGKALFPAGDVFIQLMCTCTSKNLLAASLVPVV